MSFEYSKKVVTHDSRKTRDIRIIYYLLLWSRSIAIKIFSRILRAAAPVFIHLQNNIADEERRASWFAKLLC